MKETYSVSEPDVAGSAADNRGGFHSAMVHLYRGEMNRMTVWRSRLDTTNNWAILLTTGMTTFTLGTPNIPHYILLLGLALIGICILIESRRYLHLLQSKWRCYLLEANYFARQLGPEVPEQDPEWKKHLATDLREAPMPCSLLFAIRLRLRRNYILLVYFVSAVWLTKVFIHPEGPSSLGEFHARLAVGALFPSWFVAATATVFISVCTILAVTTPSEEKLDAMMAAGSGPCARKR